jgi:glycosyltransferase involved in cell wall biosynthesis
LEVSGRALRSHPLVKIVFLCASLEHGRDGVGDYTRHLAAECVRRGHECTAIALYDPHVGNEFEATEEGVAMVRFPAKETWSGKHLAKMAARIRENGPTWISWQFVAYGYQPKGLVPDGVRELARILRGPRSHMMLHELWIGLETTAPFRQRAVGWMQRRGLLRLLRDFPPDVLHTSNPTYQAELTRHGVASGVLGLFGNVPVTPAAGGQSDGLSRFIPLANGDARSTWLVGVTFGTLHPQWQPDATVEWLLTTAGRRGLQPAIIAAGRIGTHGAALLDAFSRRGVVVAITGEQDAPAISQLLRSADFGIAPHPWALIGKSGAAAAMLEHGLPVLVPREDWRLRHVHPQPIAASDPLLIRLSALDADKTDEWLAAKRTPAAALPGIAAEFLKALDPSQPRTRSSLAPFEKAKPTPMNFLFYVPQMAAYGGIERHVCALARAAAERGHQVLFLTTSNSLGVDLRTELNHPSIVFRELPRAREKAGKLRKILWLLNEVRRSRSRRWDIVYTNGQSALSRVVWRAASTGTRVVHHHHNAADPEEQKTWSAAFRRVLEQAPVLIGCSNATKDALNQAVGRRDARFMPYLTRCPVDSAHITDRPPHRPLRFGFSGRLIPEKGIDAILALASDPGLVNIEWHIHGAGDVYPPERFSGNPRLVYHGAFNSAAEHGAALLALDAAVLFSTHNEGMPLSLIEAMSAGLPWIATDHGGTRELAASPANTMVASPRPALAELAADVRALATRIATGKTSRVAQRAVYDKNFAPPVVAALWLEFFESKC